MLSTQTAEQKNIINTLKAEIQKKKLQLSKSKLVNKEETIQPTLQKKLAHSCPTISQIQEAIDGMKGAKSQLWKDETGLEWSLQIPDDVKTPIKLSGFYQVNWSSDYTLFCSYNVQNSQKGAFVRGNFNTNKPNTVPLRDVGRGEMVCRGNPTSCQFTTIEG